MANVTAMWPSDKKKFDLGVVVGENLEGSCGTIYGACQLLKDGGAGDFEDDKYFLDGVHSVVFCCDGCGWWCNNEELNNHTGNEELCDECLAERGGEE